MPMRKVRRIALKKAMDPQRVAFKKELFQAIAFKSRSTKCNPLLDTTAEGMVSTNDPPRTQRLKANHEAVIIISREDFHRYGVFLETAVKSAFANVEFHFREEPLYSQLTEAVVGWTGNLVVAEGGRHEPI